MRVRIVSLGLAIYQGAMEKYPYQRIESPDAIRILELLPTTAEEMHVRFLHSPLSELPTCEALSYEWGEPTREHDIICEGKILKGTSNLLVVLKRLRLSDRPRLLWIDALCINQDDAVEVMQQINLMTYLYKNAGRVLIWLGEEKSLTKKAFEMLPRLAKSLDTIETFHFPFYGGVMRLAGIGHGELSMGDSMEQYTSQEEWPAVVDVVASRSYFTRLWTAQEVALSSEESTLVLCGSLSIDWVTFYKAADLISKKVQPTPILAMLARHRRLQGKVHSQRCNLWDCVLATLRHAVTKQHDRIFALLGLVDERTRSKFSHLSYSSTPAELFRTATEAIISETQNLWHFGMIDSLNPREPSWALWLEAGTGHSPNMFPAVLLKNDHIEERPITIDGNLLNVYGFFLDTVEVASRNMSENNLKTQVMEAYERITDSCSEATQYGKPGTFIEDAIDALWQALSAYDEGVRRRSFKDMRLSFLRSIHLWRLEDHGITPEDIRQNPLLRDLDPGHPVSQSKHTKGLSEELSIRDVILQNEILKSVFDESLFLDDECDECCLSDMRGILLEERQGRNLFRGAAGFLGIGPLGGNGPAESESAVRVGDKIAILSKASLPVILRPQEDGCYSLVGSCYVLGLLHTSLYIRYGHTREKPSLIPLQLR